LLFVENKNTEAHSHQALGQKQTFVPQKSKCPHYPDSGYLQRNNQCLLKTKSGHPVNETDVGAIAKKI